MGGAVINAIREQRTVRATQWAPRAKQVGTPGHEVGPSSGSRVAALKSYNLYK